MMWFAQMKDYEPQVKKVADLEASFKLIESSLAFEAVDCQDILLKRQMKRRCRKLVVAKPADDIAHDRAVGVVESGK